MINGSSEALIGSLIQCSPLEKINVSWYVRCLITGSLLAINR